MTEFDELRQENERLIEFLYQIPVGLAEMNTQGDIGLMNSTGAQYLMPLTDSALLANLFDVLDPYAPELRNLVRLHTDHGTICEGRRIDLHALGKKGGPSHLAIGLVRIEPARVMVVIQDISRTVEQERTLFADQQRFRAIYEGVRDSMICTLGEDLRINAWNASGERLFGFALPDVAGKPLDALLALERGEGEAIDVAPGELARRSGWSELSGWSVRSDGTRFWAEGILSALHDESGTVSGFSVVLRDRTDRKVAADRLRELATTDGLTGLCNRRTFNERAEREVARRARYGTSLSVLMVDADRFKLVNDTYGHAAGDEVLRDLSRLLQGTVRVTDLAARYGGEEFVVLLPETKATGAVLLAERIRALVEASRVETEGRVLRYTVSIGIAESAAPTTSLKALLTAADAALYRAKEEGRNRAVVAPPGAGS